MLVLQNLKVYNVHLKEIKLTKTSLLLTVVIICQAAGWLATMSFIKSHICNIFTKDETENKIVKMQKHNFFLTFKICLKLELSSININFN